jgi:hypothetical protein
MHPAWHIDDVRDLIFESLDKADLISIAATSRALFEVAINKLWNTLDSFDGLICCLPPDFLERQLEREDIRRLDLYTSRVLRIRLGVGSLVELLPSRFMKAKKDMNDKMDKRTRKNLKADKSLNDKQGRKLWSKLWRDIAELRPSSHLFCNLQSVHVNNIVEPLILPLVGISGLHLREISIKQVVENQDPSLIRGFLDGLQDTPKLEYLAVRDGESGTLPAKIIRGAPLRHLRLDLPRNHKNYLRRPLKDRSILYHLLQKSTIEHLTVALDDTWLTREIRDLGDQNLPTLKTLWLNLTEFEFNWQNADQNPAAFFKLLAEPSLTVLDIKFPRYINGNMLIELMSEVNRHCQLRDLTELSFTCCNANIAGGGYPPSISPSELTTALRTLLPLQRLKHLRISVAPNFLDALDLELDDSLAEYLPALESLRLDYSAFTGYAAYVSPRSFEGLSVRKLAAFCQIFPTLTEVRIGSVAQDWRLKETRNLCHEVICTSVKSFRVIDMPSSWDVFFHEQLRKSVQRYFPESDQAKRNAPFD